MNYFFLLATRVTDHTGLQAILKPYTDENITNFTNSPGINVLLFAENYDQVKYAWYGINRYKNNVNFGFSSSNISKQYKCKSYPCVIAFNNGSLVQTEKPKTQSIKFTRWISHILDGYIHKIQNSEDIRLLFESTKPVFFNIDDETVPTDFPQNTHLYFASSKQFEAFNVNFTKGLYSYHPIFQTIEPVTDINSVLHSNVVHPKGIRITERQYLAGYILDPANASENQLHLEIVHKLSEKQEFSNFFFTAISSNDASYIVEAGSFHKALPPYFFVLNTSDLNRTNKRWCIIPRQSLLDQSYITEFLTNISLGIQNYSLVSQPIPTERDPYMQNVVRAVGINVEDIVFQEGKDVLLAITATWCHHCHELLPILSQIADILEGKCVCAYIEADINEIPSTIPQKGGYPSLYFYSSTNKTAVPYGGPRNLDKMLEFLGEHCTPNFDPYDIEVPDSTNSL